jgi:nucleotide-binding universal stress UspA family protein
MMMSDVSDRPVVVVGIDGSGLSVGALKWAMTYARERQGRVLAVTGWEVPWTIFVSPTYTESDYAREAREALERVVRDATREGTDVPVDTRLIQSRPAHALTMAAEEAELLVVGSHGQGELPGMHLGSVATYCVHHAPCPVLVFRGAHSGR